MTRSALPLVLLTSIALGGCSSIIIESSSQGEAETTGDGDGDASSTTGDEESDSVGDGDGDPASGDGDGDDPSGDGDGDDPSGDGDGDDPSGDGDGDDPSGDGDGDDPSGDGDGDEPPPPPLPANVLLLGDGMTDAAITASLEAANHTVTSGGNYWDWNNSPTPDDFDVVIYVEAASEGAGLKNMARNALEDFVQAGGAVIRTEWATLGLDNSSAVDMMFPVTRPMPMPMPPWAYETTWTAELPQHPIAAGAPASFSPIETGCTIVEPKPNAVVVFSSDVCGPALTYLEIGDNGGHMLHINDDFGADYNADPDANVLALLNYAVSWLAVN